MPEKFRLSQFRRNGSAVDSIERATGTGRPIMYVAGKVVLATTRLAGQKYYAI
jgi:hypothetical protein